jgi:hypothetical protein
LHQPFHFGFLWQGMISHYSIVGVACLHIINI